MYASKEDLGWDPTISMKLGDNLNKTTYTYDIAGLKFITDLPDWICDYRASEMHGPGTRVLIGHILIDGKKDKEVVLKDFWMPDDRKPEPETLTEILESISDEEDKKFVKDHVLWPIRYERVRVGGVEDHTEKVMQRGNLHPGSTWQAVRVPLFRKEGVYGITKSYWNKITNDAPHVGRYHYRIIFGINGETFDTIEDSSDLFRVYSDTFSSEYLLVSLFICFVSDNHHQRCNVSTQLDGFMVILVRGVYIHIKILIQTRLGE